MNYNVVIEKRAKKFIDSQTKEQQLRILNAIGKLPDGDTKPLQSYESIFRLRVGAYRIIYKKQDSILLITIVDAGNRGQIYKSYR
jgi:mRNA interferase RelE/StbE